METNCTQQEILLLTGTSFTAAHLCKADDKADSLTEKERLEEACWNGLLKTILPEVCPQAPDGGELYIWQVRAATFFLELELSREPIDIDKVFSIDPYSFLSTLAYS
jgi:hypothetical protein